MPMGALTSTIWIKRFALVKMTTGSTGITNRIETPEWSSLNWLSGPLTPSTDDEVVGGFTVDEKPFAQYRECTDELYEQGEVDEGGAHDYKTR